MARQSRNPFIRGMTKSTSKTSIFSVSSGSLPSRVARAACSSFSRAACPSTASIASKPCFTSTALTTFRIVGLSSTTRTRVVIRGVERPDSPIDLSAAERSRALESSAFGILDLRKDHRQGVLRALERLPVRVPLRSGLAGLRRLDLELVFDLGEALLEIGDARGGGRGGGRLRVALQPQLAPQRRGVHVELRELVVRLADLAKR